MKVSVIVLIYNSELQSILLTLKSILNQKWLNNIEIIIADDGSNKKYDHEIINYFKKYDFTNYMFAPSEKNVGTVNNILRALQYCTGEYVKPMGVDDLLFSDDVLYKIYLKMKKGNYKCVFGNIKSYTVEDKTIKNHSFTAPLYKHVYKNENIIRIKRNMILGNDYISGASMMYETHFLKKELSKLSGIIKYTEDCIQVPIILSGTFIKYIPIDFILYKVGTGISTNKNGNIKIKQDHKNFYAYIKNNYQDSTVISLDRRDKLPRYLRALIMWIQNPCIRLRIYFRNYNLIHYKKMKMNDCLGFLSDSAFTQEFGLK